MRARKTAGDILVDGWIWVEQIVTLLLLPRARLFVKLLASGWVEDSLSREPSRWYPAQCLIEAFVKPIRDTNDERKAMPV